MHTVIESLILFVILFGPMITIGVIAAATYENETRRRLRRDNE